MKLLDHASVRQIGPTLLAYCISDKKKLVTQILQLIAYRSGTETILLHDKFWQHEVLF